LNPGLFILKSVTDTQLLLSHQGLKTKTEEGWLLIAQTEGLVDSLGDEVWDSWALYV
jgi:hypothetical protein